MTAPERPYSTLVRPLSFESTPNLYFLSFDGLAPQVLQREYLNVETTHLMELLNAEFRRFPNMFAESIYSHIALQIVASLDPEIYWSAHSTRLGPGYVTGNSPSPLFDILDANGYQRTFVLHNSYFGSQGPNVDRMPTYSDRSVCELLDPSVTKVSFWGYCSLPIPGHVDEGTRTETLTWTLQELRRIIRDSDALGPQFVLIYAKNPGHATLAFDYFDPDMRVSYRDQWIRNSDDAAPLLAEIIDDLEEHDPSAVLFVFGDHGIRLSEASVDFEDDPDFVVKDGFGVYGGIYPRDACEPWLDDLSSEPYLTHLDVVHAILRCLSGGQEALVGSREKLIRNGQSGIPDDGVERSFADFVYE